MHIETRPPRSLRAWTLLVAALALACAGFVALGVWQIGRLAWKEALIARVERGLAAPPSAAPGPREWPALACEADEYRRVALRGEFAHEHETLVAGTTALGSGYWVITPLRTEQGFWLLVNRGFVPPEWRDRARRRADEPAGPQTVTGLLRWTEPGGRLWQRNDPAAQRWYSRDVAAIAGARGLAAAAPGLPVAPYYVDAAAGDAAAAGAWPRPGLTMVRFSNNHRVYAATWFALAAMAAAAIAYLVIDERRARRMAGGPPVVIRSTARHLAEPGH